MVSSLEDKLKLLSDYYLDLYMSSQPSESNIKQYLGDSVLPERSQVQQKLKPDISLVELEMAISQMKPEKTPSPDGIPAEFYKTFKDELTLYFIDLLQYCYTEGAVPVSWKEARLVLIPKEGKDHRSPAAYQPLPMLNTDYKILVTILANRMNTIIATCVHKDQTGFIRGGYLKNNTRTVLNIIQPSTKLSGDIS